MSQLQPISPHPAGGPPRADEWRELLDVEYNAIQDRQIKLPAFNGPNPWVRFLQEMIDGLPEDLRVEMAPYYPGYPRYRFPDALLRGILGVAADNPREKDLLVYLQDGNIDPREVQRKRRDLSESEYSSWLDDELARLDDELSGKDY